MATILLMLLLIDAGISRILSLVEDLINLGNSIFHLENSKISRFWN